MMKIKKILIMLAAISMTAAFASCGKEKESSSVDNLDSATREELALIAAQDSRLTGELENKTVKWMANWGFSTESHSELVVFQERYGGKVEETIVPWESRYEKLATSIKDRKSVV